MDLMRFLKRMNNTCVILVLVFAFVSCTLSSYLDIPPPPERPIRFKTKEQIEQYLKAVKDYYDAFKIKLVRRENEHFSNNNNQNDNIEDLNDSSESTEQFADLYHKNQLLKNFLQQRQRKQELKTLFK